MKTLINFRSLTAVAMLVIMSFVAQAQWTAGENLKTAMAVTLAKGQVLSDRSDYGYVDGICFLGAFLAEGKQAGITYTLNAGTEYIFVGGAGSNVTDLDISVYNSAGTRLASDILTDANPVASFTPTRTGSYTIYLKLYSTRSTGDFCALALMKKGGYTVSTSRLSSAINRLHSVGANVNSNYGARMHDVEGQWCFWGGVVTSGNDISMTNLKLGSEQHVLVAAGDSSVDDIDMILSDGTSQYSDNESDSTPVVIHRSYSYKTYSLKVKNYQSSGRALVVAAILTI